MARAATAWRKTMRQEIDPSGILNALPDPVLVIGGRNEILYVNLEAQEFFDCGAAALIGLPLTELLPEDSPVYFLIDQARVSGASMSEYGVTLDTPKIGVHLVTVRVAPLGEPADCVVMSLHEKSITRKIDNQLTHRNAARSVTAMAAMLAHEVKNPLSGIRGAAQLLEQNASEPDRELTRLICDESDRIVALVDRMEVFSDKRPPDRTRRQHPQRAGTCPQGSPERLRADGPLHRAVRSVAAGRLWQQGPAHPGFPQPD